MAAVKQKINWRNFWICFFISMGSAAWGYPASIIGVTLGQPSFLLYMGLIDENGLTPGADGLIGAMTGVFQAGACIGIIAMSYIMDKYGRRAGILFCCINSIVGGVMLCAAQNPTMFIIFRLFAGAGSWGFLTISPVYVAELAPPAIRGFFVGMTGIFVGIGYCTASYVGLGFYFTNNPAIQWRAPLGIALVFPVIMLIVIAFVPESPRWLLMQDRADEARAIVFKLHSTSEDTNEEFVRGEFYQMQQQAQLDRTLNPSWIEMFARPSYRRRTLLAVGFGFFSSTLGAIVIANYGPRIYSSLGFGTRDQLILTCGWITVAPPFEFLGVWIVDRVGRRPLMLLGLTGCVACLVVECIMVALFADAGTNKAGLGVAVAAFYVFLAIYSVGVDVAGYVFFSEIFPNHTRAKGLAIYTCTISATSIILLEVTASAFAVLGWKFYLIFIIVSSVGIVIFWFVLPETKGIPLEEVAAVFGDTDDVMAYVKDIRVDPNTHDLMIKDKKGEEGGELERVATEFDGHGHGKKNPHANHVEAVEEGYVKKEG